MPAKRLPWYKVWAEHTDHPKICELSDGEYRTWHYLLAKASQQPERWTFASIRHAAVVTGRPEKQVKALTERGLLDFTAAGLVIHNAPKWQEVYPSDYSFKTPPILREGSGDYSERLPLDTDTDTDTEKSTNVDPRIPEIFGKYQRLIQPQARLIDAARDKIRTRLKTFTADELCDAVQHFANDSWEMEHNAHRGAAWFFDSDKRIEQYVNLAQRDYRPMKVVY